MVQQEIEQWLEQFELQSLFHEQTCAQMIIHRLKSGETLIQSGDQLNMLYVLVEGKLKISMTLPNGRSLLLRFCYPVSMIGDVELVNKELANCTVEAVSEATLIAVPHRVLQEREMNNPTFLVYLLDQVCHKLNTISLSASVNLLTSVESRFASYLLSISQNQPYLHFKRGELETTKLTEIAELLGTSYRHLNRVMKKFIEQGLIERQYSGIVLRDLQGLEELSNGNLYR
ncbi:catabolite gene activator protein [Paenibacillus montaniterrae]|uniref:Catabolite gene activator protein n=1 Tax=Paenibacillus montaniterrae TaxID=429341 RepID=A0A919YSU4_9BACL|nr:cyclic nucleotide-binding domain-containing protein [Paenibacillus montaniterrae]GIP18567.1 catabolite gene activator protein [Paenibacillus montaniterrae]